MPRTEPIPPAGPVSTIKWTTLKDALPLPDDDITVLVATDDGQVDTGYHSDGAWYWSHGETIEDACPDIRVTYWADLPDHPEGA